jgi:uncharacterized protein YxjI
VDFLVYSFEKENAFFSNKWIVFDEEDNEVYTVKHPGFFSSDNILMMNQLGVVVLEISWNFWKTNFKLIQNEVEIANVSKSTALFHKEFFITTADGTEVTIKGHWLRNEFRFMKGDDEFAYVSRKRFAFAHDRYGVAIRAEINPLFILGAVIVIQVIIRAQEGSV